MPASASLSTAATEASVETGDMITTSTPVAIKVSIEDDSLATSLCEFVPFKSIPSAAPAASIPTLISPKNPAVSKYSAPTLILAEADDEKIIKVDIIINKNLFIYSSMKVFLYKNYRSILFDNKIYFHKIYIV